MSQMYPHTTVLIPTIGTRFLLKAVDSVLQQKYDGMIRCLVVIDGPQYADPILELCKHIVLPKQRTLEIITLPFNTGRNKYNGHLIYAAFGGLVQGQLALLDEDNMWTPNHLYLLTQARGEKSWAFALRSIIDETDAIVTHDMCESLGSISHTCCHPKDFLVDINCYLFTADAFRQVRKCLAVPARPPPPDMECDRAMIQQLLRLEHGVSKAFTILYRVGAARPDSVQGAFFIEGNKHMSHLHLEDCVESDYGRTVQSLTHVPVVHAFNGIHVKDDHVVFGYGTPNAYPIPWFKRWPIAVTTTERTRRCVSPRWTGPIPKDFDVFDGDWSTVQYMLFQLLENQQVPPEFFEATYMGIYPILTYAPNVMPRLPFLTVMQWHILSHWVHPNELDQCYKQCLEKEADINLSKSSPHYKAALQMYRDSCDPVKLATMITSYANWMSQFRPSALQHLIDFQPL